MKVEKAAWNEIEQIARELGGLIQSLMPKGFGYTLAIYRFGEGGELTYVSSGRRSDVVKLLRELATVLEHNADAPHGAKGHPARNMGPKS